MKTDHAILTLCRHLEVSPSGYYAWQQRRARPGPRRAQDQVLAREIQQIHSRSRQTYGSPRVEDALRKKGLCHGRNRIARLMKEQGLYGRPKARYRVPTTASNHDQPIAPNRLLEAPKATAANQIWVADITYIETAEGWLYLAAILDLYSRKIVGCLDFVFLLMWTGNVPVAHRQVVDQGGPNEEPGTGARPDSFGRIHHSIIDRNDALQDVDGKGGKT